MYYIKCILPLIAIIFSSALSGCSWSQVKKGKFYKPMGMVYMYMPDTDNKAFLKGWYDGCTTGMSIFTKEFHKQFYSFRKDIRFIKKSRDEYFEGQLITEDDRKAYNRAWSMIMRACRHYSVGGFKSGGDGWGESMPSLANGSTGNDGSYSVHKFGKLEQAQHVYEISAWGPVGIANW